MEFKLRKESLKQKFCPNCGNKAAVYDFQSKETVCDLCGCVLEQEKISRGPEYRIFTPQDKDTKPRVTTIPLKVPTEIGPYYDSKGKRIQPSSQTLRLRKWQSRIAQDSITRNIRRAQNILNRLADNLHISRIVKETTMVIYKKALRKNLIRGRSINAIMAAALYAACRIMHIPKSPKQISKEANIDSKEINRDYRLLRLELKLQIPLTKHSIHIERIAGNLNISMKSQQLAWEIIQKAQEERLTAGKDPKGLAAAALYIVCIQCGEKRNQEEIADVAGVTKLTVRNRYKELKQALNIEMKNGYNARLFKTTLVNYGILEVAENLNVSNKTKEEAVSILEQISGQITKRFKKPKGFAAAVLLKVANKNKEKITIQDVAGASGILSEETIKRNCRYLDKNFSSFF